MLWKGFENKSHQRRARYLKPHRNGGPIPTGWGGSRSPPPPLTRVKIKVEQKQFKLPDLGETFEKIIKLKKLQRKIIQFIVK